MARMRERKAQLREWLESADWKTHMAALSQMDGREVLGPLLSFLLLGGDLTARAAVALGVSVSGLAETEPEAARNILRRFMWHMNEESGNIGWGIPEAFAEILARSPKMAKEFHSILLSYIYDTGHDDNYCDQDVLRRSCYCAVGRLAQSRQDLCAPALPWLVKGLGDVDIPCRGMAAWALGQFPPFLEAEPMLRVLMDSGVDEVCFIFDGENIQERKVVELARQCLCR